MTAATVVSQGANTLTPERPLIIDELTITSDYTYTPSIPAGKDIRIISCYNNTDGASVVVTNASNVLTMGHGQTLSGENVVLTYTLV